MIPEPKSNSLMLELANVAKHGDAAQRFKIAGIERQAKELIDTRVAQAAGWEILAACAGLRGSLPGVKSAYAKGKQAPDRDAFSDLRYAGAFADAGDEQMVKRLALSSVGQWAENETILSLAADVLGRCGFLIEARRLRAKVRQLRGEPALGEDAAFDGWDPDEISSPIVFTRHFLASRGIAATGALSWSGEGPRETRALICRITVALDPARAADEEELLYEALAEKNYAAEASGRLIIALAPRPHTHGEVVCP